MLFQDCPPASISPRAGSMLTPVLHRRARMLTWRPGRSARSSKCFLKILQTAGVLREKVKAIEVLLARHEHGPVQPSMPGQRHGPALFQGADHARQAREQSDGITVEVGSQRAQQ